MGPIIFIEPVVPIWMQQTDTIIDLDRWFDGVSFYIYIYIYDSLCEIISAHKMLGSLKRLLCVGIRRGDPHNLMVSFHYYINLCDVAFMLG